MWTSWGLEPPGAFAAAAGFALFVAALLDHAAYRLPRALDGRITDERSTAHQRYRTGFWAASPLLAMLFAWHFGPTPAAAAAIAYATTLIALAWVDAETGLLPDMLTLPLLWTGLLINLNGAFALLPDAVIGAVAGYMTPWCICQLFLLVTGRRGMGHGDFKFLAALGAWLGWTSLPWILLISSSLALAAALPGRLTGRIKAGDPLRFGPYLAVAGILAMLRL